MIKYRFNILISVFIFLLLLMVGCGSQSSSESPIEEQDVNQSEEIVEEKAGDPAVENEIDDADPTLIEDDQLSLYYEELGELMINLGDLMFLFDDLHHEAVVNPMLLTEESWKWDMVIALTAMEEQIMAVKALSSPVKVEDMHTIVLEAMDEYLFVVENYPRAIDEVDAALMEQCVEALDRGTVLIDEAHSLFDY